MYIHINNKVSLDIGATSETDITETVIVNTLATVLVGLGVTTSNILDYTYTSWTASRRRRLDPTSEEGMMVDHHEHKFRQLSGVASVSANVVMDLSDTTYTSAASLASAISSTVSAAQTDGSLSVNFCILFSSRPPPPPSLSSFIMLFEEFIYFLFLQL
jgi:hypothetical protein